MIHYSKLKSLLKEKGVVIHQPLFHGTNRIQPILNSGLRSCVNESFSDSALRNEVCVSRSLELYTNTELDLVWNHVSFILIFEERDIRSRLKMYPVNFGVDNPKNFEHGGNKTLFEYESRLKSKKGETFIPAKYIKAILVNFYKYPHKLDTDIPTLYFRSNSIVQDVDSARKNLIKNLLDKISVQKKDLFSIPIPPDLGSWLINASEEIEALIEKRTGATAMIAPTGNVLKVQLFR